MAASLSRIHNQIELLQKQAEKLKTGIVQRLRKEIASHGLTAEDLFGASAGVPAAQRGGGLRVKAAAKSSGVARAAKYGDGTGQTWGGFGKRPTWLRKALEAGASLEDFLLKGKKATKPGMSAASTEAKTAAAPSARPSKRASRKQVAAKTPAAKKAAKDAAPARTVAKKASAKQFKKPRVAKSAVSGQASGPAEASAS
ncbi:H-NS family nucleoid-associated regulatory protein [Roseateles sp. LYH14W]|uniref:H-NS family nucleoid-associated regulatory protein n=1 Tax=Pelomonas parva TaxID=3299032 RepID=A0ABW7FAR5_9BURK